MERTDLARLLGLAGDLRLLSVDSAALAGNPLGDPALREIPVYLPPGYDAESSRRYPVLYWLHGYAASAAAQVATAAHGANVVQRLDRMIVRNEVPPVLLAAVDGDTRLGGAQYVDSIHNGAYATYAARDVVAAVDAAYRTRAAPAGRAIFGKSSGGFGAFHLTLAHPGVFGALAMHSADAGFGTAYAPLFTHAQRTLERYGGDVAAFVAAYEAEAEAGPAAFATREACALAAAYSPRAARPFAFDLPFDGRTAERRPEIFARWLAFDPVERVAEGRNALAALRLIYVDCGRRDEYALDLGARVLVDRMRACGLAVRHEEFDGGHGGTGGRHAVSVPALVRALG